jgi:SOS-response transcriptional repressor LexA
MAVSRWESGSHAPPSHIYIELGTLAGDPDCWYFWARAGLRTEDLMRVLPKLISRINKRSHQGVQTARAGSGGKKTEETQVVAIPLLQIFAGTPGEMGDSSPSLHDVPVESMIAAPKEWCPNPATTSCLRVRGNSMSPLIKDGYIVVVDSSQKDRNALNGKLVIAWHKSIGLTVSEFRRYGDVEVLHPENREYKSLILDNKREWEILATVLWWIGKAP